MAETFKKLYQGQPGTSVATVYTAPASTQVIVKHMRAVNTSGSTTTIALYQDGSAAANQILPPLTLGAGEWAEFDGAILIDAAGTLQAIAGAATAITLTVYGLEIA